LPEKFSGSPKNNGFASIRASEGLHPPPSPWLVRLCVNPRFAVEVSILAVIVSAY